jgi:hypothetical protein
MGECGEGPGKQVAARGIKRAASPCRCWFIGWSEAECVHTIRREGYASKQNECCCDLANLFA